MTFGEMVSRVKELLDKDDNSVAFVNQIKHALNVGYLTVARDKWRPVHSEVKSVSDMCVAISTLSKRYVSLKSVRTVNGIHVSARGGKDYIHLVSPYSSVAVEYYYLPDDMSADSDIPVIPEAQVDPYAYIYFAVAQYLNTRHMHAEAAVWENKYKNITDNIHETRGCVNIPSGRWV